MILERTFLDLNDPRRLSHHQFHATGSGRPEVAGLDVKWQIGLGITRFLRICQEGFADVVHSHFFDILKRFDGRILACACPPPDTHQKGKRLKVGMDVHVHAVSI